MASNSYFYVGANPTVDLIVFNDFGDEFNKILLIKRREGAVEGGKWALPGGFHDSFAENGTLWKEGRESAEDAAFRELQEETNLDLNLYPEVRDSIVKIGVFEGSGRDPRDNDVSWSKSSAFGVVLPDCVDKSDIKGLTDAVDAKWYLFEEIKNLDVAFDHLEIISQAIKKLNMDVPMDKAKRIFGI